MNSKFIKNLLELSNLATEMILLKEPYEKAFHTLGESIKVGGKILVIGNGGSASDANHFVGEMVGRFLKERKALPAISLTNDNATITAIANDYGYDAVFERQLEALFDPRKDTLLTMSTSGNSENVIRAINYVNEVGGCSVNLLGKDGGKIAKLEGENYNVIVGSHETPRIQEIHQFILHQFAEDIENAMFG